MFEGAVPVPGDVHCIWRTCHGGGLFHRERRGLTKRRRKLNEAAVLTDADITPKLMIDVAMPLAYNSIRADGTDGEA